MTTGGPLTENKPPIIPDISPIIKPVNRDGLILILSVKKKKYMLSANRAAPKMQIRVLCVTLLTNVTAIYVEIQFPMNGNIRFFQFVFL